MMFDLHRKPTRVKQHTCDVLYYYPMTTRLGIIIFTAPICVKLSFMRVPIIIQRVIHLTEVVSRLDNVVLYR